jgi:hypothetical protein
VRAALVVAELFARTDPNGLFRTQQNYVLNDAGL